MQNIALVVVLCSSRRTWRRGNLFLRIHQELVERSSAEFAVGSGKWAQTFVLIL
jgi:hypothetical protein